MTRVTDERGTFIPVTVIEAEPCTVLAVRTEKKHGYNALQIGYGKRRNKNVTRSIQGHVAAAGLSGHSPHTIREVRLDEAAEESVGDTVDVTMFEANDYVDVTGVTKGKGFQGVVKRYRFAGGRASHGGDWMRRGGSIGMCVNPGKVYRGRKMPGQQGNVQRTVQNLSIVQVRPDDNVILVKGAIPGPNGRIVLVRHAIKKKAKK